MRDRLLTHLGVIVSELKTLYTGVQYLGELSPRSLDAISAMGERLSCEIAAAALEAAGVASRSIDARGLLVTNDDFGASDVNLSFVVAEGDAERAVRMLHAEFFEAQA